ncbi:hypothetical protein PENTCL1PPCAC_16527, partial [Pristionchus entomophagus]
MGDSAEIQQCNDGGFNKLFLQQSENLHAFNSYLGRAFELKFYEESSRDSVPSFVYRLDRDAFDTNSEKNIGMRYENVE